MFECPEFLEVEDEMIGTNSVAARVTRETAEAMLGRALHDRADFVAWVEAYRDRLLHAAFLKRLSSPAYSPGEDRTMMIEAIDLQS